MKSQECMELSYIYINSELSYFFYHCWKLKIIINYKFFMPTYTNTV